MPWTGGQYELPPGTVVAANTPIEASWANTLTADLETAISECLNINGENTMTIPFPNADGSLVAPGITYAAEPTSGWWREGNGDIRFGLLGNEFFRHTLNGSIPQFDIWDDTEADWRRMPTPFDDVTVDGVWEFTQNILVRDLDVDNQRVEIRPNRIWLYGDPAASGDGASTILFGRYEDPDYLLRYTLGPASDADLGDFRFEYYDDLGVYEGTIWQWQRNTSTFQFDSKTQFGTPGDRKDIFIYDDLVADGQTSTWVTPGGGTDVPVPPSSAYFGKGLDSEDNLRLWARTGGSQTGVSLQWGAYIDDAAGAGWNNMSDGDYNQLYQMEVALGTGNWTFSSWDTGTNAILDTIMQFTRGTNTMRYGQNIIPESASPVNNFYYRTGWASRPWIVRGGLTTITQDYDGHTVVGLDPIGEFQVQMSTVIDGWHIKWFNDRTGRQVISGAGLYTFYAYVGGVRTSGNNLDIADNGFAELWARNNNSIYAIGDVTVF